MSTRCYSVSSRIICMLSRERHLSLSVSLVVSFLGFIAGKGTVGMDPEKVSAVCDWPVPENHKQLQWFLGFANFY